jgi:hypothetical protein
LHLSMEFHLNGNIFPHTNSKLFWLYFESEKEGINLEIRNHG